jgi:hypothetical protein
MKVCEPRIRVSRLPAGQTATGTLLVIAVATHPRESIVMQMRAKTGALLAVATLLAAAALVLTGCAGDGDAASPETTPSATASGGVLGGLDAVRTYLEQVRPIADQVAETAGELPGAVKDLSVKPDESWTESAADLDAIAGQLDDEAASLAALTPPAALQPVQDAAVSGIESARSAVGKLSDALDRRAASAATRQSKVESQVRGLSDQLAQLSRSLTDAIGALLGSPGTSPSP